MKTEHPNAAGIVSWREGRTIAMSATITVEEAQATLTELIGRPSLGEEIVITKDQQPVAKLVGQRPPERKPRHEKRVACLIRIRSQSTP